MGYWTRARIHERSEATKRGLARCRAEGMKLGRPRKRMDSGEVRRAVQMRAKGLGLRAIAVALSKRRVDSVSYSLVRRVLLDREQHQFWSSKKESTKDVSTKTNPPTNATKGS